MQQPIRYVTAAERRWLPDTFAGWAMLAGVGVMILAVFGMGMGLMAGLANPEEAPRPQMPPEASRPQQAEPLPATEPESRSEADRREAQLEYEFAAAQVYLDSFKSRLRDPGSARFRDMWLVRHSYQGALEGTIGAVAVCGTVNAQNAFGAYTGERMFIASMQAMMTSDDPAFAQPFQAICMDGRKQMQMR